MEEEKKDPRDLNGDGKVTLEEKLTYAATVASEKLSKAAGEVKEGAKKLYDKAAPKAKELFAEAREKGEALAEKAHDKLESLKEKKEPKEDPKNGIPSLAEAPAVFEKAALEDIILEQAELRIH